MNTNPVNNVNSSAIPASVDAHNNQSPAWGLIRTHETVEYTEWYKTPSGHNIQIVTTDNPSSTRLKIVVYNEFGCVTACDTCFSGINYEDSYNAFYEGYMQSSCLQLICERFDELCTWYEDDDEDEE